MLGHNQRRDSHVRGGNHARVEASRARCLCQAYRNEIPQHHHRDSPSSRVGCGPCVLNGQHGCGCGKFGTKRPQVQILSPRPCFRRPEALTRVGEGLSCCPYRSKIPQVPQQIRTFELLITWVPPAGAALRWDEEAAAQILSPRTEFWRVISEGKCRKEHSKTGLASETSTHSRSTRTPPVRWRSCAWGNPARLETVWLGGKERPASTDQVRGFCDLLRDQTPADQTAAGGSGRSG